MDDEKELFLKSFEEKLKKQLDSKTLSKLKGSANFNEDLSSFDYKKFRLETLSKGFSLYEKSCYYAEKLFNIKPDNKSAETFRKQAYEAHLSVSPAGIMSLTVGVVLILAMLGVLALLFISSVIGFGLIFISLGAYFAFQKIPFLFASKGKAKASDQIVIAIFYLVAFMRFSSNFELAVNFAANYLGPPLSLDFKRILWEVDNSKYPNIKKAFDNYLEKWRDDNLEFLEAVYMIESSLYESEEIRRIGLLDKALDVILMGNYEKMLHFAQELKGKVSTFNMLGVVLPTLGLIILPLVASFSDPKMIWQTTFMLYDILLPIIIGYTGLNIILNRPTSANSIKAPHFSKKYMNELEKIKIKISKRKSIYISTKVIGFSIFIIFILIGLLPILLHITGQDIILNNILKSIFSKNSPFGEFSNFVTISKSGNAYVFGPYGVFPGLLSLFIPLGFAFGIGYHLKNKYKKLIHIRDKTKILEKEFPSATFQLGNRLNEGISAELCFGMVSDTMKGTETGIFFSEIDKNIKFNGFSVRRAIFDEEKGAILNYPSDLIVSSMKILINALDKGPEITAKTLVDLSRYLTEIHLSSERMLDLLSESLGSMKSQSNFLAPLISGIVISIVSLVTMIMGNLTKATKTLSSGAGSAGGGLSTASFLGNSMPTFLFQPEVGLFVVFLIGILVYMTTNLESGNDPINSKFNIGSKLISSTTIYAIVVFAGILAFTFVGAQILPTIS